MDFDLTEYDQVEEIKLFMDNNGGQMYSDGASSKFLVTLSSGSYQASLDDINCENDFVFLPETPKHVQSTTIPITSKSSNHLGTEEAVFFEKVVPVSMMKPLSIMENRSGINNPFHRRVQQATSSCNEAIECAMLLQDSNFFKPIGVTEACSSIQDAKKLPELMQQIVIRSDSIHIEIVCTYCKRRVTCPPADLTNWLNHMKDQHNCRVCPICKRLIGLGPKKDINIMKQHVVGHLDMNWLEQSEEKSSFTFGLQRKWFSGSACEIRDLR